MDKAKFVPALPPDFKGTELRKYENSHRSHEPIPSGGVAILICNLPENYGEYSLRPLLERMGVVLQFRPMSDPYSTNGCLAALVVYSNTEQADRAVKKFDGFELIPNHVIYACRYYGEEDGDGDDPDDRWAMNEPDDDDGDRNRGLEFDFQPLISVVSSVLQFVSLVYHNYVKKNMDKKMDDKPIKVDKWDGSAVKNALDDAVKKVFTEKLKYMESHKLMDGRLAISGIAVGAAMFALLWDYLYPFPESRPILILCVVSYFILMGVLTLYTTFVEKGIFLEAIDRDGIDPDKIWRASSSLKRFDHMYHLVISFEDSATKTTRDHSLEKSVSTWFDDNGTLLYDVFEPEILSLHNFLIEKKKN